MRLRIDQRSPYNQVIGVGGIGSGIFFALDGNTTLGRDESRLGKLLDIRDYCKLHIISHYIAKLLDAGEQADVRVMGVGKVGDDGPGRQMVAEMNAAGIDTRHVETVAGAPTLLSVCFQYPDGTGGNLTTNNSAAALLSAADVDVIENLFTKQTIALAAPEVPLATRAHLLEVAGRHGAFRAGSFAAAEVEEAVKLGVFQNLELVSLNEGEAAALVGVRLDMQHPEIFLDTCARKVKSSYSELRVIVTAGREGAYGYWRGTWNVCPAVPVKVASTAGAGDALLGGVIAALAAGVPFLGRDERRMRMGDRFLSTALEFGVLLGSFTVRSPHTIHPDANLDALLVFAREHGVSFAQEITDLFDGVEAQVATK